MKDPKNSGNALVPSFILACFILAGTLTGCTLTQQSRTAPDGNGTANEINIDFNEEFKQDVTNAMDSTRKEFDDTMTNIDAELKQLGDKAKNTELQLKIKQFNKERDLINVRYQHMEDDSRKDDADNSRVKEEWTEVKNDMKDLWQAIRDESGRNDKS